MKIRSAGKHTDEPDAHLMIQKGVAYRYLLLLGEPELIAGMFRILKEVSISMEYLLLFPEKSGKACKVYLGLASSDVGDLPFRFAAIGIGVRRGEEVREVNC